MGRVIEEVSGTGDIHEGDNRLGEADYDLTIYQESEKYSTFGGGGGEVDTMGRISGTVKVKAPLDSFNLLGKPLTLHLEDGRLWDFLLQDMRGRAVNTGNGIRKP